MGTLARWAVVSVFVFALSGCGGISSSGPQSAAQIKELIDLGVPDASIRHDIDSLGLSFTPTQADLDDLRQAGAGPLTLEAIGKLMPRVEEARTIEEPPDPIVPIIDQYFRAVRAGDNGALSSLALEPFRPDVATWEVVYSGPETSAASPWPMLLRRMEAAREAQDAQIGPTIDADTALKDAQYEMDMARSASAKDALRRKVEDLQGKYDAENARMQELKRAYNDAKSAHALEEEKTLFSLGMRELPPGGPWAGTVYAREARVAIRTGDGASATYRFRFVRYVLEHGGTGQTLQGRWVIVGIQPVG